MEPYTHGVVAVAGPRATIVADQSELSNRAVIPTLGMMAGVLRSPPLRRESISMQMVKDHVESWRTSVTGDMTQCSGEESAQQHSTDHIGRIVHAYEDACDENYKTDNSKADVKSRSSRPQRELRGHWGTRYPAHEP